MVIKRIKSVLLFLLFAIVMTFVVLIIPFLASQYGPQRFGKLFKEQVAYAALATRTPYVAFATITATQLNANENSILNAVNNIENAQVAVGAGITDSKLATIATTGKVTETALNKSANTNWYTLTAVDSSVDNADALHSHSAGSLSGNISSLSGNITAAQHGDLSSATSNMHSASSVVVADPQSRFVSGNVEGALTEVASFVGYNGAGGATATNLMYLGIASGTTLVGSPLIYTVPGDNTTGLDGVIVNVSGRVRCAAAGTNEGWTTMTADNDNISQFIYVTCAGGMNSTFMSANMYDYNFAAHGFTAGNSLTITMGAWYDSSGIGDTFLIFPRFTVYGYK